MPLKPENIALQARIEAGVRKAHRKLIKERAVNNETVIVSVEGRPTEVSAREILKNVYGKTWKEVDEYSVYEQGERRNP